MIPMLLRMDVRDQERTKVRFWFPIVIGWIVLFALMLAALPFMLIGALATRGSGPGARLLLLYPRLFAVVNALSGLRVDVQKRGSEKVFISFD
jgi:hypothetical protein